MCADAPPPPDMSGVNAAAQAQASISKEALDWYKQIYAEQAPLREQASRRAFEVSDAQLASMRQNDEISRDYWNYQTGTFRPLERRIVDKAERFDTPERQEAEAGRAVADVAQQAGLARQTQMRDMGRMGVNPNSGRFAAMSNQMTLGTATASAQAANQARRNIELQGQARRMDAASLGRNLPGNQATSAGVALSAGANAANTGQMPLNQAQSAAGMMGQGFNTAIQGNQSAGNLFGQAANAQAQHNQAVASANSGLFGDLASIGMSAAKLWPSDKNKKKNIKRMSDEKALQAVKDTPVSEWDYKKGVADEGRHTGPMAQDVRRTMGEQAAPGGKMVDLITLNGVNMAATAALARKVDKLSKKVEGAKT